MEILQQKKLLIARILPLVVGAPNAAQELLQQSVEDLARILEDVSRKHAQHQANEQTDAHIQEMHRASKADGAWAHALLNTWLNGKRLVDVQSNRDMLERLLQPHEEPTAAIYETLALQYPQKLTWELPRAVKTDADRLAEFQKICRENLLSECLANQQLHKDGVSLDAWAGASGLERAKFQEEAAQARQKFLIHDATPSQLKAEAAYQSQTEHNAAVPAEADRRHRFVSDQQRGLYPPLPAVNGNGEALDAKYFRRISTVDYSLFKTLVKRYGSSQITSRLRSEN